MLTGWDDRGKFTNVVKENVIKEQNRNYNSLRRRKIKVSNQPKFNIAYINMQGGERIGKWIEITNSMIEENLDIYLVTETHLREQDLPPLEKGFGWIGQNRKGREKKGGGVGVLYREKTGLQVVNITRCEEHIWCTIKAEESNLHIAVIYMATRKEDTNWNQGLWRCLEKDMLGIRKMNESIAILGDFNGHLLELDGFEDENGRNMVEFAERHNLQILNLYGKCEGKVTWHGRQQISTIDYVLSNDVFENKVSKMTIDEEGDASLGSDHNRIIIEMKTKGNNHPRKIINKNRGREVWDTNDKEGLIRFGNLLDAEIEQSKENELKYESFMANMVKVGKLSIKRKVVGEQKKRRLKSWWDKEIQTGILERKKACREHRKAVKRKDTGENIEILWKRYQEEKEKVKTMISKKIMRGKNRIKDIIGKGKDEAKKFWKHVQEIKGSNMEEPQITIKDGNGILITDEKDIAREIERAMEEGNIKGDVEQDHNDRNNKEDNLLCRMISELTI